MGLPNANIIIGNGALGATAIGEYGIFGMLLSGVAVVDNIALLEPTQVFSLDDVKALGIDAAYDTANSVGVYRQLKEFYDEAGDGTELWFMLVSPTVTMADMADKTETNYAVKLINAAQGKIRVLIISRVPDGAYVPTITNGLDGDVFTALVNANAMAEEFAGKNNPIRVILEGRLFSGTPGDLKDLKTEDKNRVAIMIGGSLNDKSCSVGLLAGRLADDPIKRNPGRVKSGSLVLVDAYVGDLAVEMNENVVGAIHDKGYISIRTISGKSGYFFTDAPMATADTDDYATMPAGRVVDAAHLIAFRTFMNEVLDEIEVDDNGYISPAIVKGWEANIERAVKGDIGDQMSKFEAEIDPKQNILAVSTVKVKLRITPVGYSRDFEIELGFNNPFSA